MSPVEEGRERSKAGQDVSSVSVCDIGQDKAVKVAQGLAVSARVEGALSL